MLAALTPDARRAMGNLLHQQAREQLQHDRLFESHELGDLERLGGARGAQSAFGTGGGRVRRAAVEPS